MGKTAIRLTAQADAAQGTGRTADHRGRQDHANTAERIVRPGRGARSEACGEEFGRVGTADGQVGCHEKDENDESRSERAFGAWNTKGRGNSAGREKVMDVGGDPRSP